MTKGATGDTKGGIESGRREVVTQMLKRDEDDEDGDIFEM